MKIFFDTEFQEMGDGLIIPISVGLIREDDATFYTQICGLRKTQLSPWVLENVGKHLEFSYIDVDGIPSITGLAPWFAAMQIEHFVGESPEFWADYGAYDWVKLCQLFGTMMDLPNGWPMFCHEFQQVLDTPIVCPDGTKTTNRHVLNTDGPRQRPETLHHALHDAIHLKCQYDYLFDV